MRRAVAVIAVILAGCVGSNEPDRVPVSGTVFLGTEPLANATVTFIPIEGTPGFGGVGRTDASGHYVLRGSRDNAPGIPPGDYRVVISKRVNPDGTELPPDDQTPMMMSPAVESLADEYSSMASSRLTAKVPPGGKSIDFALKPKPKAKK